MVMDQSAKPSATAKSRRAAAIVTMKPAITSNKVMTMIRKKTEVAKAGRSKNSTKQTINKIRENAWFITAARPIPVDLISSKNSINNAPEINAWPGVICQVAPLVIGMAKTSVSNRNRMLSTVDKVAPPKARIL